VSLLLAGVARKVRVYRGFRIVVVREGTWCEANIYRATDGRLEEHLGSGTYGGSHTYETFFRHGERVIDAMHGGLTWRRSASSGLGS
jgi:hypothetical protein